MESTWSDAVLASKRSLWVLALILLLIFSITNLPWELDDYDQAKQAFTSFEMMQEGHWLYQRTPDDWVATKPPLVGWISAATFAVTRCWEISWRVPSFIAAVALSILLLRAARRAYRKEAALIALSAFGFNLLSPRLATLVRTDMALTLVIFLIGLQAWQKIRKRQRWTTRDRVILFALLTAGMLIKGPIIYAFVLPGIIFFQWRARRRHLDLSAWAGWWPWIASLTIFLLWVAGGIVFVPEFFDRVIVREFAARFAEVGEHVHRSQSTLFYLPHLLHKFAPWSLLLIGLAIVDLRAARSRWRETFSKMSPETFWLLLWGLGGLIVMSLIPSKRVDRIFPIVPPLCLLLAAQFAETRSEDFAPRARQFFAGAIIFAVIFSGGYSIAKIIGGYRAQQNALVAFGKKFREEAEAKHLRYEIIGGRGGGILLYLRRTHFIETDQAVSEWNAVHLDALIGPEEDADDLMKQLPGISASHLDFVERPGTNLRYFVLRRE